MKKNRKFNFFPFPHFKHAEKFSEAYEDRYFAQASGVWYDYQYSDEFQPVRDWVLSHPDEILTNKKVAELLKTK